MGVVRSIKGTVTLKLTSGYIEGTLVRLTEAGIILRDIQIQDELTAVIQIDRCDYRKVRKITDEKGDGIEFVGRMGIYWRAKAFLRRPVLVLASLLLLLSMILPKVVLFVQVEGNETVASRKILEVAADRGIRFGASARAVRSEKMKNALLSAIPELQWAGVNTYGSVAVITVRERSSEEQKDEDTGISSIVASRDGVIISVTVTAGSSQCQAGQAVQAGDMLISGYTDCGLCITAGRAEGEIFALTNRMLTAVTLSDTVTRTVATDKKTKFCLLIGKNRINFYKGSGIYDASCVKMYSKYVLTLPGGFELPVALLKETVTKYSTAAGASSDAEKLLQNFAAAYLQNRMVAGTVDHSQESVRHVPGAWELTGSYVCREMIGKRQQEQIGVVP